MRLAIITSITLASRLLFGADVAPGRGHSFCESSPKSCAWPGQGRPDREVTDAVATSTATPKKAPPKSSKRQSNETRTDKNSEPGNLPGYYSTSRERGVGGVDGVVIVPDKPTGAALAGLRPGDILQAVLDQSIKASPSVPTPIRVLVTSGRFRGAFILGTATLDRELKRILLSFDRLRLPGNDTGYVFKATGLAPSGQVGLEGDHHTQEGLYFAGELLASGAAGYADATTQRTQTLTGTYQIEPSVGNAAKQGAVTALSKSAERYAERSRSAPEYTEIDAGREIQVILQETPTEAAGG